MILPEHGINSTATFGLTFTPGVGGTYKRPAQPSSLSPRVDEEVDTTSPGCENTLTAGNDTIGFCSDKPVTCSYKRSLEPTRRVDAMRNSMPSPVAIKEVVVETCKARPEIPLFLIFALLFLAYRRRS